MNQRLLLRARLNRVYDCNRSLQAVAIVGAISQDAQMMRAVYLVMNLTTDMLLSR